MITDTLNNITLYRNVPGLGQAAEYILSHDLNALPDGKTEIDGNDFYVMIQRPGLKAPEDAKPEAHNRYIDIQVVLEGEEVMGYAPREDCGEPSVAKPESDIWFYDNPAFSPVHLRKDCFAVFFPEDGHAPCIRTKSCTKNKKAVFKVKIS